MTGFREQYAHYAHNQKAALSLGMVRMKCTKCLVDVRIMRTLL